MRQEFIRQLPLFAGLHPDYQKLLSYDLELSTFEPQVEIQKQAYTRARARQQTHTCTHTGARARTLCETHVNATSFAHVPIDKHCDAKHQPCTLGPFQGQEVDRIYFIRDGTVTIHPSPRVDPRSSGSPGGHVAALQPLVEALQPLIAARYPARASLGLAIQRD